MMSRSNSTTRYVTVSSVSRTAAAYRSSGSGSGQTRTPSHGGPKAVHRSIQSVTASTNPSDGMAWRIHRSTTSAYRTLQRPSGLAPALRKFRNAGLVGDHLLHGPISDRHVGLPDPRLRGGVLGDSADVKNKLKLPKAVTQLLPQRPDDALNGQFPRRKRTWGVPDG
jgi:hypothetical protein